MFSKNYCDRFALITFTFEMRFSYSIWTSGKIPALTTEHSNHNRRRCKPIKLHTTIYRLSKKSAPVIWGWLISNYLAFSLEDCCSQYRLTTSRRDRIRAVENNPNSSAPAVRMNDHECCVAVFVIIEWVENDAATQLAMNETNCTPRKHSIEPDFSFFSSLVIRRIGFSLMMDGIVRYASLIVLQSVWYLVLSSVWFDFSYLIRQATFLSYMWHKLFYKSHWSYR